MDASSKARRRARILGLIALVSAVCLASAILILRLLGIGETPVPDRGLPNSVFITFAACGLFGVFFVPFALVAGAFGARWTLMTAVLFYLAAWTVLPRFPLINYVGHTFSGDGAPETGRLVFLTVMALFALVPILIAAPIGFHVSRRHSIAA